MTRVDEALLGDHRPRFIGTATSGVEDHPICHGAAGLTHIFNRFYQATGEEGFRRAAEDWLDRLFAYRQPGQGLCGFPAPTTEGWLDEPGLLIGAAGIGLVLLGLVGEAEPAWDRVLTL